MPTPAPSAVRREYDALAASYDRRWSAYVARSLALLRPLFRDEPPGRLLDVGCGTAALVPLLREWGAAPAAYAGVDPSLPMLRAGAPRLRPGAREALVAGAAEALPFRAGAFDTAVSVSTLQYWSDPRRALAEVRRVLRPGGRLVLLAWSRDYASMRLLGAWLHLTRTPFERMHAEREAASLLRAAGFHVRDQGRAKISPLWGLMWFDASAKD